MTRVLVTGGRHYEDEQRVILELAKFVARYGETLIVIHGDCPTGADHFANTFCETFKVPMLKWPAKWDQFGKSAGYRRNAHMLKYGQPTHGLVFPGGEGTAHMRKLMEDDGNIDVCVIP